jgi:tetratricopeptide (TPR) repeat protein
VTYAFLGDYPKSNAAALEALKLNPGSGNDYVNLAYSYQWIDQLDQAKATVRESRAHNIDSPWLPLVLYNVYFLEGDGGGMQQQVAAGAGKKGVDDQVLFLESETAANGGRFKDALELTRRAAESAQRAGEKEAAAHPGRSASEPGKRRRAGYRQEQSGCSIESIAGAQPFRAGRPDPRITPKGSFQPIANRGKTW